MMKRYYKGRLDFALNEKSRSGAPPKIRGKMEAHLTRLNAKKSAQARLLIHEIITIMFINEN